MNTRSTWYLPVRFLWLSLALLGSGCGSSFDGPASVRLDSGWEYKRGDPDDLDTGLADWTTGPGWSPTSHLIFPTTDTPAYLWLRTRLPASPRAEEWLVFPPTFLATEVRLEQKLILSFAFSGNTAEEKQATTTPHLVALPTRTLEQTLYVRLRSSETGNIGLLGYPYVGGLRATLRTLIELDLYSLIVSVLFLVAGLVSLVVYLTRRQMEYAELSLPFGVFALSCGFVFLGGTLLVRTFIPSPVFWYYVNKVAFQLFPVGLFAFFAGLVLPQYKPWVRRLWQFHLAFALVTTAIDPFNLIGSQTVRTFYLAVLTLSTCIVLVIAVLSWKSGNRGVRVYLLGFLACGLSGIHDLLFLGFQVDVDQPEWFMTGAVLLLFALAYVLEQGFASGVKELRETHRQLEDYSQSLAKMVEERTEELQGKNEELTRTLKKLEQAKDTLVQAEKMASLGNLTAGIAHELKNPLNFVNNFASLSVDLARDLREELDDLSLDVRPTASEDVSDLLNDIEMNAHKIVVHGQRADSIIRGMMAHARGTGGAPERVEVNSFVEEYVNLSFFGFRARHPGFKVVVERDYDPAVGSARIVTADMGRVVINLMDNALYIVRQLAEETTRSSFPFRPSVWVKTENLEEGIEIRFRDNGGGVPEHLADRIFEPFFTTKPSGSGTGLGLSLSYDIVTAGHGGKLWLENAPGEGATFVILLPGEGLPAATESP